MRSRHLDRIRILPMGEFRHSASDKFRLNRFRQLLLPNCRPVRAKALAARSVVIRRPDEIAARRAALQQDRKNFFRNVPFQYVASKDTKCRFTSHSPFAFRIILYKNKPQTTSQWSALSLKCYHLPPLEILRGADFFFGFKSESARAFAMTRLTPIASWGTA